MARKRDGFSSNDKPKNSAIKETQPTIQSDLYKGKIRKHSNKDIRLVNHFVNNSLAKTASADISQGAPLFYHPDFEPSSLMLPKDRIEINSWCNYFYKYDPLVATAIDTHAELPLSKIKLDIPKTKNKELANRVLEHYVEMIGNAGMDLFNKLLMIGIEYNKIGNVFPWAQMNSDGTGWERISCLDPDSINLERLNLTDTLQITLNPNDRLRYIVNSGPTNERTGLIYQSLPEDVIELVKSGRPIPLETDPNSGSHIAHIARKLADYHTWGTSLIERNFKTLVYKDRLRQSQDAIATRHLTPKHIIWADNASHADVREIREQVEDAMMNPDQSIIANYELHWDLVGTSNGLMQLQSEYEWINDELFIGLMINKSFLLGEGPYSGGQTVLEVLAQKYSIFRETLESYIEKSLFAPIARNCGFIEYEPGTLKKGRKEKLIYPKVRWNKLNLVDDTQHKQMLAQMVAEGKLDITTWFEYFGLNSDAIADRMKQNEDTVLDPAYMELRRTMMNEIGRSLGPEVAKIYAQAMNITLPQDDQGGGFMPTASDKSLVRFKSDVKVDYGPDGNIIVSPELEKVSMNINAETREERARDRENAQSSRHVENIKENLEVKPTEKREKPERKDLKKKKNVKLFDAVETIKSFRRNGEDKSVEINPDLTSDQIHATIPLNGTTASEVGSSGYGEVNLSNSEKEEKLKAAQQEIIDGKRAMIREYSDFGLDQEAKRVAMSLEDSVVTEFKKLANSQSLVSVEDVVSRLVPQLYSSILYASSDKKETLQKVAAQAKLAYSVDIKRSVARLMKRVSIDNDLLKKKHQDASIEKLAEAYFSREQSLRQAVRKIVVDVASQINSTFS